MFRFTSQPFLAKGFQQICFSPLRFSVMPFWEAWCLLFQPGVSPFQILVLSHLCSPQISHDGALALKPSGRSDQKCLEEPEISVERQVGTCEVSRTCRELQPAASERRKVESWSLASWGVRRWKAKQPWCISSAQGKRCYILWCLFTWDTSAPSLLSVQLSESVQHYTSRPCFVPNQPSPNAA